MSEWNVSGKGAINISSLLPCLLYFLFKGMERFPLLSQTITLAKHGRWGEQLHGEGNKQSKLKEDGEP